MFNPRYRILITRKCYPHDEVIGLGGQLISIVNNIGKYLLPHKWYAADVEAIGENVSKYDLKGIQVKLLGTDLQLIDYCKGIDQFIWGVFICVDDNFLFQDIDGLELETEDEPFRSIDFDGVLIEIRAFDTAFFELYSDNYEFIRKIADDYDIEIEKLKLEDEK